MQFFWAEEHSRALREYLETGLTYSEIADALNARFNTAFTRNAAIGRARRMGLSGEEPAPRAGGRPRPKPQPSAAQLKKLRARFLAQSRPPAESFGRATMPKLRCVEIAPRQLSLLELEEADCRYPYGGEEEGEPITFCGHPRREGSSYCVPHFHLTSGPDIETERTGTGRKTALRLVEAA
jgi:GcrA cell cycle regulator